MVLFSPMNNTLLTSVYASSPAVRAIFRYVTSLKRDQAETQLLRVYDALCEEVTLPKKTELIAAFRALEIAGCGTYIEGRRGFPSRFVWGVRTSRLLELLEKQESNLLQLAEGETLDSFGDAKFLT